MSEKILVPVLGESITEATVSKWLKNKGETVNADEAIVELETDKVNLEVPASIGGVLSEVNSKEGDTVEVGSVLGIISDSKANGENIKTKNNKIQEEEKFNIDETANDLANNKEVPNIQVEPLILNEEEQPLILSEEAEIEEKTHENLEKNKNLSPALRKIIT